jgi:rubrerythrin
MLKVINFRDDTHVNIKGLKYPHPINRPSKTELDASIREYFMRLDKPILPNDVNNLRNFAKTLTPQYKIEEKQSKHQYELSINQRKNTKTNYSLDISQYGNRLFIDLNFNKIRYTQYQVSIYIFQIYTIEYHNHILEIHKVYNTITNKYISGNLTFQKINGNSWYDIIMRYDLNSRRYMIPRDDLVLAVANFAKHCKIDTGHSNLPSDVMLPASFTFTGEIGHFNIRDEITVVNKDGKEKTLHIAPLGDVIIQSVTPLLSNFSILLSNGYPQVEIDLITEKSSKIFIDIYKIGSCIDITTINTMLTERDCRLDRLFNVEGKVHSMHLRIHYRDYGQNYEFMDAKKDRKQVYHQGNLVFDGVTIRITPVPRLENDTDNINYNGAFNSGDIYVNQLSNVDLTQLECPIPWFILLDPAFQKQFVNAIYSSYSSIQYYCREHKLNDTIITECYDIDKHTKNIRHTFEVSGPNGSSTSITIYTPSGETISEYASDGVITTMGYMYKGFHVTMCEQTDVSVEKIVYLGNKLLFRGVMDNDGQTVLVNMLTDEQLERISYDPDEFITDIEIDVQHFGEEFNNDDDNTINIPNNEIVVIEGTDTEFEFTYDLPINTLGFFKWIKNIIIKRREKRALKAMAKRTYNHSGHEEVKKEIDENNKLTIKTNTEKTDKKQARWAWKAAVTQDGQQCIIKLVIPPEAKIVWSEGYDKYRVDQAIVYSIKPIINGHYVTDLNPHKCPVCLDDTVIANVMAHPCRHKLCGNCWNAIISKNGSAKCPYCKSSMNNFTVLKLTTDQKELSIPEALSFVHTADFTYTVGNKITIQNFETDLSKACGTGIHCHFNEQDPLRWFEFLDIPKWTLISASAQAQAQAQPIVDINNSNNDQPVPSAPPIDQSDRMDHTGSMNHNDKGKEEISESNHNSNNAQIDPYAKLKDEMFE